MAKSVTSSYLLRETVFALEQCGHLLRDAACLYRSDSYASAVALAAFAREELGRAGISCSVYVPKLLMAGPWPWKKSIDFVPITSPSKNGPC